VRILKDGVRILNSLSSPIHVAATKATRESVKGPPKEKHVKYLIASSVDSKVCHEMVDVLSQLIHEHRWVRTIRGLQVIHRLIQDGSPTFTKTLVSMRPANVLRMSTFRDATSHKGMENGPFIRSYGDYLVSRCMITKAHPKLRHLSRKIDIKAICANATSANPQQLFLLIKPTQQLMDDLLYCHVTDSMLENGATLSAFSLLLRDSFAIYKILSDCMIMLLDFYFTMGKDNAKKALDLYEKHIKQTDQLIELYEFTTTVNGIRSSSIPQLKSQPKSLLKNMQEYIDNRNYEKYDNDDVEAESAPLSDVLSEEDIEPIQKASTNNAEDHPSNKSSDKKPEEPVPDMFILDDMFDDNDKDSTDSSNLMSFAKSQQSANPFASTTSTQGPPPPYGSFQQQYSFQQQQYGYGGPQQGSSQNPFATPQQQNAQANPFDDDPFNSAAPQQQAQPQPPTSSVLDDFLGL